LETKGHDGSFLREVSTGGSPVLKVFSPLLFPSLAAKEGGRERRGKEAREERTAEVEKRARREKRAEKSERRRSKERRGGGERQRERTNTQGRETEGSRGEAGREQGVKKGGQ